MVGFFYIFSYVVKNNNEKENTTMGYKTEYEKSMEAYKTLVDEYEKIVGSEKYKEVCETMPFDFLNANQKFEVLKMFHAVGDHSKFNFKRADDAISFLNGFLDVRRGMDSLLDGASYVARAEEKASEINELVDSNPYLPSHLRLDTDSFVFDVSRKCLKVLPSYPLLMNISFKKAFVESCIEDLSIAGLQKLVNAKMIGKKDVEIVRASGGKEYKEKMNALREMLGFENLYYEKHDIKLAGTSFKNEDGTERQKILKSLKDADNTELTTSKGTYEKSPGVEKPSVAINWDGQTIGYVPQGTVDTMVSKYKNPEYEAKFLEVTGGGDVKYGCNVELGIVAKDLAVANEKAENGVEK